jgi:sulfide:quinone oxidoreductase
MSKTVAVLGAGVGGLTAAAELRKVLPAQGWIVLVDRSFTGSLGLSLLWVMRGWRTPEQVRVKPTPAALPGWEMVTAEVDRIDEAEQPVPRASSTLSTAPPICTAGSRRCSPDE